MCVSNDKQGVRKMGPLTPEIRKDSDITAQDVENIPNLKLREQITDLSQEVNRLRALLSKRKKRRPPSIYIPPLQPIDMSSL